MHPIEQYLKNFLGRAYPELALAITLHNVTHSTTTQAGCNTINASPLYGNTCDEVEPHTFSDQISLKSQQQCQYFKETLGICFLLYRRYLFTIANV